MSLVQLQALLPMLIVTATVVAVMLSIAIKRDHRTSVLITILGMGLALVCLIPGLVDVGGASIPVTQLMVIDGPARLGMMLILITTLGVLTVCYPYFEGYQGNRDEVYLLIGVGTLGALTLTAAQHAATLLLGLELLSLPMVAGVAYSVDQRRSIEGGVKYLVLSAAASATLLFGLALIYAQTGALDMVSLGIAIGNAGTDTPLVTTGALMLLAGLAFKLSLAPFHQWTPDVYEAAPIPITAFLATVVKLGAFIATLRLFHGAAAGASPIIVSAVAGLALASMLVGSVLALRQTNLKRLLAYSSIANFGYLAVVLAVPGADSLRAGGIYLAAYLITSIGVFGVIALVSSPMRERDVEDLSQYQGLFWHRPFVASVFIAMLLSLAGVPLTAGFIGKFAVIGAGVQAAQWWLVGGVVLASAVGAYYYLRVIGAVLATASERVSLSVQPTGWVYTAGGVMLVIVLLAVLTLGIYPQPLFDIGGHLALW
jgi:NADH-quinone oxidoreductase subunit N